MEHLSPVDSGVVASYKGAGTPAERAGREMQKSLFDRNAIEQLRRSIVTPFSQVCGTEIKTTDKDGIAESTVFVAFPGYDTDCLILVKDVPNKRGGYSGVEVKVEYDSPAIIDADPEVFSNRDTALAFIREQIARE